jgi:predicted nucleic acid-binding protein
MSDRYFVDTKILMYAHDSAGEKHARAKALVEELWESRSGAVSTVLQELAVNLRRKAKKPLDAKATRDVVSERRGGCWKVSNVWKPRRRRSSAVNRCE